MPDLGDPLGVSYRTAAGAATALALLLAAPSTSAAPSSSASDAPAARAAKAPKADEIAPKLLASMTLEEKVSQMIMSYPPLDPEAPVTVGAVIFVGNLLHSADKVRNKIADLQRRSRIPLLVAVDMEGGKLNRLKFVKSLNSVPSGRELGEAGEKDAFAWGRKVGKGMRSLGFNCNLGPVLDLADKGLMFESGRSMGADPVLVARIGKAYSKGLWAEGVVPVGKHYPGYGELEHNTDHKLVVTERSAAEIARQASAFTGVGDQLAGVMLTNVGYTSYGNIPAILSPELVAMAHQSEWITMTDDLSIATLSEATGGDQEEVMRRAFHAGNDLLLTTAPVDWKDGTDLRKVLLDLLKAHPELEKRVDESALRILRLKERAGLLEPLRATLAAKPAAPATPAPQLVAPSPAAPRAPSSMPQ